MSVPRLARIPIVKALVGKDERQAHHQVAELNNQLDELYALVSVVSGLTGAAAGIDDVVTSIRVGVNTRKGALVFVGTGGVTISIAGQTFTWDASALIPSTAFVDNETPAGLVNGLNTIFTWAFVPSPQASLVLLVAYPLTVGNPATAQAGNILVHGVGFTWTGAQQVTLARAPPTGAAIRGWYRK